MPYKIGAKGSYGCSGYPALKEGTNEVMGCHKTRSQAASQIFLINRNEGNLGKDIWDGSAFAKKKKPNYGSFLSGRSGNPTDKDLYARVVAEAKRKFDVYPSAVANSWVVQEYKRRGGKYKVTKDGHMILGDSEDYEKSDNSIWETVGRSKEEPGLGKAYEGCGCPTCKELDVNCENCPVCQANGMKSNCCGDMDKKAPCWDGYVARGMKPGEGGRMVPNCVPIGKADDLWEDSDDVVYETDSVLKAEGYSPPQGARNAAKRAIRWKEEGKAKGAGTPVGWTRAGQLARGETLSLDTVKRMFSFFSRHEVDKKGKDFYNTSNPSNGRIMWDAWGGDAGFTWSKRIADRERDKALFDEAFAVIKRKPTLGL